MTNSFLADARFAEQIIAPDYRDALNNAFEASPAEYAGQRRAVQTIMLGSILVVGATAPDEELSWEMRRQAALARMDGEDFGAFDEYLITHHQGGASKTGEVSQAGLGEGAPGPISTNSRILTLHQTESNPSQFFSAALDIIDMQKLRPATPAIGPENYASAIKFYVDKRFQDPGTTVSPEERKQMKELVTRCLAGFEAVSRRDEPNVIELTNIFAAIRRMPVGTVDQRFIPMLVKHSLGQLHDFDNRSIQTLFAAMGKVELDDVGDAAATLLDLALRKSTFETTAHMRAALKIVANLPQGRATDAAFQTFLQQRNNLELTLSPEGLDEVNDRLAIIAAQVVRDDGLKESCLKLAFRCAKQLQKLYQQAEHMGDKTPAQMDDLKRLLDRAIHNMRIINRTLPESRLSKAINGRPG